MYYHPENTMIFRIRTMPRSRVQHQKGLSDDAFEQRYPDEEACRKAWFAWRWPEGFKCPRCAATEYSQIRDRQLLQCRACRYQTSLIAGTALQGTTLPLPVELRMAECVLHDAPGTSFRAVRSIPRARRAPRRAPRLRVRQTERGQIKSPPPGPRIVGSTENLPRSPPALSPRS